MKKSLAAALIAACLAPATFADPEPDLSILQVNVTAQGWNFRQPWQKLSPADRTALGPLMEGNKVLTTASIVSDAVYIELEKPGSGEKITAKVDAVDYEANLALIAPVEANEKFFDGMVPMDVDPTPVVGDELEIWQVEDNGTPVVNKAVITKIDIDQYFLDSSYFLIYEATGSVQFRAASRLLPIARGGKLAGLLLSYSTRDQVSSILAAPIIEHFLKDVAEGEYDGFPNLGLSYAPTLDDQFRKYLNLNGDDDGVFVSGVQKGGSADKAGIKEGDVILAVDGHSIDRRGDYEDPKYGKLNLSHLVKGAATVGQELKIDLLRGGEKTSVNAKLERKLPGEYLVDSYMFDRGPNFLILGGLLFQELTLPYLETFGDEWDTRAPFRLVYTATHQEEFEDEGRRKVVFLSGVLPSLSTQGYEGLHSLVVTKVNGKQITDMKALDDALASPKDGIHRIEFTDFPKVIFVDATMAQQDNESLMPNRYHIFKTKRIDEE
ncbi:MAG: PDZ domain-containing protein [Verrucomicrobiales bacterium]